jgi:hypothetical protein
MVMQALWQAPPGQWLTLRALANDLGSDRPTRRLHPVIIRLARSGYVTRCQPFPGSHWRCRATLTRDEFLAQRVLAILEYAPSPHTVLARASERVREKPA